VDGGYRVAEPARRSLPVWLGHFPKSPSPIPQKHRTGWWNSLNGECAKHVLFRTVRDFLPRLPVWLGRVMWERGANEWAVIVAKKFLLPCFLISTIYWKT